MIRAFILVLIGPSFLASCASVGELQDVGHQPPIQSGLLSPYEMNLLESTLETKGASTYRISIGNRGNAPSAVERRGLIMMRSPRSLIRVDGDYYTDGRGNLIFYGPFRGSKHFAFGPSASYGYGIPTYSITLFSGGGQQLVIDTDGDGTVDLGASEGLRDRFGFFARPDHQHALECLRRAVQQDVGPTSALPLCLGEDDNGAGGGNGGGGGGIGTGDSASWTDPQCGRNLPAATPRFADGSLTKFLGKLGQQIFGNFVRPPTLNYMDEIGPGDPLDTNSDGHFDRTEQELFERDLRQSDSNHDGEISTAENNDAHNRAKRRKEEYNDMMGWEDVDGDSVPDMSADPGEGSGGPSQPAPGPDGTLPPESSDPRCEEPSTWNRLGTEECASNMAECIMKLTDPVFGATGGRCETVIGPDDRPIARCGGNESFGQCIVDEGTVVECAEQHAGDTDSGISPGENDDIFEENRGSLNFGLMEVHPFGAAMAALCTKAGGLCGDPVPPMGERR